MTKRLVDLAFAALLFGVSIWFWTIADALPESRRFAGADADFWPKIVFGALALVAGAQVIHSAFGLRHAIETAPETSVDTANKRAGALRVGAMGALILGYYFGFQYMGFVAATMLFLWLASLVVPYRSLAVRLIFAPVFTFALALFFTRVLSLPLPRGRGIFYDLSLLLY